jgi:DNA-binding MarR family transcriptional regulator
VPDLPYAVDDPEHRLAVALTEARRAWPSWYRYAYEPFDELDSGQYDVLWCLAVRLPGGCPMGELASALRIDSSTATRAVDRLVASGLAERVRSQHDKRVLVARATAEGLRLVDDMSRQATRRWRATLHSALSPPEIALLAEWLERVVGAFDAAVSAGVNDGRDSQARGQDM